MSPKTESQMQNACSLETLMRRLAHYPSQMIIGNTAALFATLFTVVAPLFIPILVDEILLAKSHGFIDFIKHRFFNSTPEGYVAFVLALILVLRLLSVALSVLQSKVFTHISKEIVFRLRRDALLHLKGVTLESYETLKSGGVTSKLVSDIETIDNFISVTVSKLVIAVLVLFFSSIVLLWIDWRLGVFLLVSNPVVVYFTAKMSRKVSLYKREENKAVETFQSALTEVLDLMVQVRASNKENYFFDRIILKAQRLKAHAFRFGYKSDAAQKYSYLIFLSGYEVFRAVSILAVMHSDLSVGLMLAVFSYLWVMVTPTQDLITFQYALANAKAACDRLNNIFALPLEPQRQDRCDPFRDKAPSLSIDGVSFGYEKGKEVLRDISLSIPAGSKVAIVGPSGSGKTTLARLIVGFYTPTSGKILYGACPHDKLSLKHIRQHVHLILQHPKLFNATMRFNLTLGDPYTQAQIDRAIEIAQLGPLIRRLEKGLNTLVGKDGIKLSGGERQRVAIARMVLADPKVVILDESTSALDVHTESVLFKALEVFWREKTVITIAHRLSTVEKARYVYVLENGRLSDQGVPKVLLSKNEGYFATML